MYRSCGAHSNEWEECRLLPKRPWITVLDLHLEYGVLSCQFSIPVPGWEPSSWISLCRTGFLLFFVYSLSVLPQTANSCSSTAPRSNHSQRKLWFNGILTWRDCSDQWSFEQTRLRGATRLIGSQAVSPFFFDDVSEGSNKS